jgi:hypothetical protein
VTLVKTILQYGAALAILLNAGCAEMVSSPGSPQDPIFPRTGSILPLARSNAWAYSFTAYDILGRKIVPNRLNYHISINEQFGFVNDSALVMLDRSNYGPQFSRFAYLYVREGIVDSSFLVVSHDMTSLSKRGLYIIGMYIGDTVRLYAAEQFWLAYPADSGKTWSFKTDPLSDTTLEDTMEVLSINARFYVPDSSSMSGLTALDSCYLYKQKSANNVSYYYYNKNIGCLGYQRYIGGILRETYILTSSEVW